MICSTAAIDCSARWNYARNNGKDLDFYVYLMRKSVNYNLAIRVKYSRELWYASADDEEVLNLVYSRAYKRKKDYE